MKETGSKGRLVQRFPPLLSLLSPRTHVESMRNSDASEKGSRFDPQDVFLLRGLVDEFRRRAVDVGRGEEGRSGELKNQAPDFVRNVGDGHDGKLEDEKDVRDDLGELKDMDDLRNERKEGRKRRR